MRVFYHIIFEMLKILRQNETIGSFLKKGHTFSLQKCNEKLGTIHTLQFESNTSNQYLSKLLESILSNDFNMTNVSYYEIMEELKDIKNDSGLMLELLDPIVSNKLQLISESIKNIDKYTLSVYNQIVEEFNDFQRKIVTVMSSHCPQLVKKVIPNGNDFMINILSLYLWGSFYDKIINQNKKMIESIIDNLCQNEHNITIDNINQIFSFANNLRMFLSFKNYATFIDQNYVIPLIKKIVSNHHTLNIINMSVHNDILSIYNISFHGRLNVDKFSTEELEKKQKDLMIQIYKNISLINIYGMTDFTHVIYSKFMQQRLADIKYCIVELEVELVSRLTKCDKNKITDMVNIVGDVAISRTISNTIHNINIGSKSEEFKNVQISNTAINCLLLKEEKWNSLKHPDLILTLSPELEYCKRIVDTIFDKMHKSKDEVIVLRPTMGRVEMEATFKKKKVFIKCTVLQALVLTFFNKNPDNAISIPSFCSDTNMPYELAEKVFESIQIENIIKPIEGTTIFALNHNAYFKSSRINLIKSFVDAFDTNKEYDPSEDFVTGSDRIKKMFATIKKNNGEDFYEEESDGSDGSDGSADSPSLRGSTVPQLG